MVLACAVENGSSMQLGRNCQSFHVDRTIEAFVELNARGMKILQRGDKLIGVLEIEIGCFEKARGDDSCISDFGWAGDHVACGQILFDRLEWVDSWAQFEVGEDVIFPMMDVEDCFHRCIDFKIFAFEISRHPHIAVFIPGKDRVRFPASALGAKGPLHSVSAFDIFGIEEAVCAKIVAGCEGGEAVRRQIFALQSASPTFSPPIFSSSIDGKILPGIELIAKAHFWTFIPVHIVAENGLFKSL